jgi:hypothetical protein
MQSFIKSFDDGMYHEAHNFRDPETKLKPHSFEWYAGRARSEGIYPEKDELVRREEHYLKQFHIPREDWDGLSDRSVKIKAYAADTWALERVFKEGGVTVRGEFADEVEKAFGTSTVLTIFPFFWDTAIQEGILAEPLLDILLMDTKNVDSGTAVHAFMNETEADRNMGEVGEFTTFPEVYISATESAIKLKKFGGKVNYSDESLRRMRIPVFQRGVSRIGRQIGILMTSFAIDVIMNGDSQLGGAFGAATQIAATVPGSPTYNDWVVLATEAPIGYDYSDFVFSKTGLRKALNVVEFKDPLAGFKFQSQKVIPEIMGMQPHRWDHAYPTSPLNTVTGNGTSVLMLERNLALTMYTDGGLSSESQRVPDGQYTRFLTSWWVGFGCWDRNAVRVGTGFA